MPKLNPKPGGYRREGLTNTIGAQAAPDARKMPETTKEDILACIPVAFCSAAAHSFSVFALSGAPALPHHFSPAAPLLFKYIACCCGLLLPAPLLAHLSAGRSGTACSIDLPRSSCPTTYG